MFGCRYCFRRFDDYDDLETHKERAHPDEYDLERRKHGLKSDGGPR